MRWSFNPDLRWIDCMADLAFWRWTCKRVGGLTWPGAA